MKLLDFHRVVLGLVIVGLTAPMAEASRRKNKPWLCFSSHRSTATAKTVRVASRRHIVAEAPILAKKEKIVPLEANASSRVVKEALQYAGTPYRFGGMSKSGIDCSGLVKRIYDNLSSMRLPRTSSQICRLGEPVKKGDLRPGDVICFKNTYKRGISHVGIYAGKNKFVHAANRKKGVIVTALSEPYYERHFAGARRLY